MLKHLEPQPLGHPTIVYVSVDKEWRSRIVVIALSHSDRAMKVSSCTFIDMIPLDHLLFGAINRSRHFQDTRTITPWARKEQA